MLQNVLEHRMVWPRDHDDEVQFCNVKKWTISWTDPDHPHI